jgi:Zn-dependent protease with chaperone function
MAEYAAQSIVHAAIAAVIVEILIHRWRLRVPDVRLRLRLLVLGVPVLVPLVSAFVAPQRGSGSFRDEWALVDLARWTELPFGGAAWFRAGLGLAAAAGGALFVVDLIAFWRDRVGGAEPSAASFESVGRVTDLVASLAASLGVPPPGVIVLADDSPHLLCAGLTRPGIVVSRGTIARLSDAELRNALAHELAHIAHRDGRAGWLLVAVRGALWFNPVVQVVARQIVQEIEWRADDGAAASSGDPGALASALDAMAPSADEPSTEEGRASAHDWSLGRALRRARRHAILVRRDRLGATSRDDEERALGRFRWAITAGAVMVLAFFVV